MGCTVVHTKGAKVIPTRSSVKCRAKHITEVLPSGAWNGRRCFIIGGGPSLKHFDYSVLDNELVIGVNKAFIVYPARITYAMDLRFYDILSHPPKHDKGARELHSKWLEYKGIKLFLRTSRKVKFDPTVYYVDSLKKKAVSYNLVQGLYGGNNSGFGALALAIALGCRKIGLLGFDLSVDKKKKRSHWHKGYPGQTLLDLPKKLESFAKCFEEFAPTIKQQRIKVVNLNPGSKLQCFSKMKVHDFLQSKK